MNIVRKFIYFCCSRSQVFKCFKILVGEVFESVEGLQSWGMGHSGLSDCSPQWPEHASEMTAVTNWL